MTIALANVSRTEAIVAALSRVAPAGAALHEPEFAGNEWAYVKECLDTGWVSSAGAYVDRFEAALREFTGARHAVATVNGTSALHTALLVAGVARDDEVIVPALTFVATANAVAYIGAHPHIADSDGATLGIDPEKLEDHLNHIADENLRNRTTGRRIAAVLCTHVFGHPVALDRLDRVCRRFGVALIEDAAESLGSTFLGRHAGTWGALSALSFNGNKTVTTGGGGAVLTDDDRLAAAARHLTTTAKTDHPWTTRHDRVGYNYRMPNINAALGCAQLEQLPGFLERKRRLAGRYQRVFADVPGVRVVDEPPGARSNFWLNALLVEDGDARDHVLAASRQKGIETRPAWEPMHRLPMFQECPRMDLSVAESLCRRLVNLPSSPRLADGDHGGA